MDPKITPEMSGGRKLEKLEETQMDTERTCFPERKVRPGIMEIRLTN